MSVSISDENGKSFIIICWEKIAWVNNFRDSYQLCIIFVYYVIPPTYPSLALPFLSLCLFTIITCSYPCNILKPYETRMRIHSCLIHFGLKSFKDSLFFYFKCCKILCAL